VNSSYVVDASVAAKWFLPQAGETLVAESLRIFEGYASGRIGLAVPDLFWPELGNVFWKAVRLGRMTKQSGEEALAAMIRQTIPTTPSAPLLADAFAIATTFQCTVYDATYVALAVTARTPLLTADERLAGRLAGEMPVRWLGSIAAE
jgi:predicted nucleic acid-binding protein